MSYKIVYQQTITGTYAMLLDTGPPDVPVLKPLSHALLPEKSNMSACPSIYNFRINGPVVKQG